MIKSVIAIKTITLQDKITARVQRLKAGAIERNLKTKSRCKPV